MHNSVICLSCKWVSFPVSRDYIAKWQEEWNRYWSTLDEEGRDMFGLPNGPPGPEQYYKCSLCGGDYKNFRDATDDEVPFGSTIGPILDRNE